jgi:hypothetical protein
MTLRSKVGALALPFLIGALTLRLALAPAGDAIARAVASVAPAARSAPRLPEPSRQGDRAEANEGASAPSETDGDEVITPGLGMPAPRRVASRGTATRHREGAASLVASVGNGDGAEGAPTLAKEKSDGGADGGRGPSLTDAPKATIVVPALLVAKAMERRDVGATNATAPDGSPLGARLAGVSKYRAGLRDGDVVVSVAGARTPTVEAMIGAAMAAASSGAGRISGRIVRGDATFAVVLELPK